jgi:DNA-directed RNA polymerase sigma subunit (sigma70/sigma32)
MINMINKIINTKLCCEEFDFDKTEILKIKDDSIVSPDENTNIRLINEYLFKCINQFSKQEQFVIIKRFGFCGNNPETQDCIAKQIGCHRSQIREIELRVFRKLRHPRFKITELINEI